MNEIMNIDDKIFTIRGKRVMLDYDLANLFGVTTKAFTEHGAVMCANILKSDKAVEASVQIVRAFVKMRSILIEYKELKTRIDKLENKYDRHFKIWKQFLTFGCKYLFVAAAVGCGFCPSPPGSATECN